MKRNITKLLSVVLAVVLVVGLLPATALAWAVYDIWVSGVQVTGLNADDVLSDGGTVVFTSATGSEPAKLTLKDADIVGTSLLAHPDDNFGIYSEIDLTLELHGKNTITAEDAVSDAVSCGISMRAFPKKMHLVIDGDGTLNVTAGKGDSSWAVRATEMTMRGGTVRATAGEASRSAAVSCIDFVMEGGTLEATSGKAENSCAVEADALTMLGGTLEATAANGESNCAIEAIEMTMQNGTVRATAGDATGESCAIYPDELIMEGGTLEATAGKAEYSCGIDSTSFTILGGTVRATGGEGSDDSVAIMAMEFVMEGGTLEATAGKGYRTYGVETDSMTVLGGAILASAGNASGWCKAVYSNHFTMEGGSLIALGGEAKESWGIDGGGPISGGTLTAIGYTAALGGADLSGYANPNVKVNTEPTEIGASAWNGTDKLGGLGNDIKYVKVAPHNPFSDVSEGQYYHEPVLWAVRHDPQITTGTSADRFSPNATCTRAQVVTFLWRAMGQPEPTLAVNPFTDVKEGQYYYRAVLWALEEGITTGTSADKFSPNTGCTRGQVVTFLHRAQGTPAPGSSVNPFTDVAAGQYYYDAVLWAVNHSPQITNGTSATAFSPNATCTRGQIVTFLYRAFNVPPVYRGYNVLKDDDFLLYVENVLTVIGRGTVVSGRVLNGRVDVGDRLRLLSWDSSNIAKEYTVKVEGIEMFRETVDYAEKGDYIGLLISGTAKENVQIGAALVDVGTERRFKAYAGSITGDLHVNSTEEGGLDKSIFMSDKLRFYYGGVSEVTGYFTDLGDVMECEPGKDYTGVAVGYVRPSAFWYVGQEIAIREGDRTVGTFTVTLIEQ